MFYFFFFFKFCIVFAFSYAYYSYVSVLGIFSLKSMGYDVSLLGLKVELVGLHFSFLSISSLYDHGYFAFFSLNFPYL